MEETTQVCYNIEDVIVPAPVDINTVLTEGAVAPMYATDGAAGMDIHCLKDANIVRGDMPMLIYTGVHMQPPKGYEIQVRPRSGLSLKGLVICNSPGTIDSDYTGEIKIIMRLLSSSPKKYFNLYAGDRIAQLVLAKVPKMELTLVDSLEDTARAAGGFGSTGVN